MRKTIILGISAAAILFTGCAKNSEQTYIESPKFNTSKSINEFIVDSLPQCPKNKEIKVSSLLNSVDYIKSIDIENNKDGTQTTNVEINPIEYGEKIFFSGCRNIDGTYIFRIVKENKKLKAIKKIVL